MRRSRVTSNASVASTVSDVDQSANDRVLLYPKGYITISLDIPRSKCMFVVVKVKNTALNVFLMLFRIRLVNYCMI